MSGELLQRPEGEPDPLLPRVMQGLLELQSTSNGEARRLLPRQGTTFDVTSYERVLEKPVCRELGPEDWQRIGALYQHCEVSSDVFEALGQGEMAEAETQLAKGGTLDRWQPSALERNALLRYNPSYQSSGDEFLTFLQQRHGRAAEFRAWGVEDPQNHSIAAVSCAFIPPNGPEGISAHADQINNFFQGPSHQPIGQKSHFFPSPRFEDERQFVAEHAGRIAECYLVMSSVRGGATIAFQHMLDAVEQEQRNIDAWYLLRFGSLQQVCEGKLENHMLAPEADNLESRRFFKRRNFSTCGEVKVDGNLCAREGHGNSVVVAKPTWHLMLAKDPAVRSGSQTEVAELRTKAAAARRDA